MISTLSAAKLHQPGLPPKYVRRPHLVSQLNQGWEMGRLLTLISAPAGFGKTTCACEWIASLDARSVWLALDPGDDDPVRFLAYILAALQKIEAGVGSDIEQVLRSGELPSVEGAATNLANEIQAIADRFVLVLDDFHVIQDRSNLELIERLLANRSERLHLVLVTREDPLLPLARLRANNQLTELRGADLRFTEDEAAQFMREMMGVSLSANDIDILENRTEGWAAGLQLVGLSMRGRGDPSGFIAGLSGNHRYILSYLTEEVLEQQSGEIRKFLLQTSILDRLNGPLCDAVSGRTDSAALLEHMFNSNLFLISLDDEGHAYRFHHLFADLLRNQQNRAGKEETSRLHQRAGQWYAQAGMAPEAIQHALAGEVYPEAIRLVEAHAMPMIMQGYAKTVEGWMQAIPENWHSHNPRANLAMAWMYLLRGAYAKIPAYLEQAETGIANLDPQNEGLTALRGEWLACKANLLNIQGKVSASLEMADRALQAIPAGDLSARGLAYLGMGGAYRLGGDYPNLLKAYQQAIQDSRAAGNLLPEMLGVAALEMMAIRHGQLRFAAEIGSQAVERIEQMGITPPIAGTVYGMLGVVYYEWNQLDQAREHIQRAGQLIALSGHNAGAVYSRVLEARLCMAQDDLETAVRLTGEAADLVQLGTPLWVKPEVAYQQVRAYLALRNPSAAEAALNSFSRQAGERGVDPFGLFQLARLEISLYRARETGQIVQAAAGIALADRLVAEAKADERMGTLLQALLLRALLNDTLGNSPASLADLECALEIGEPEGYVRTFVDEGSAVAALLRRVRTGSSRKETIDRLLAAFPDGDGKAAPGPDQQRLVEPLSERELEVLRLMAEGLKYEEMAQRLVIALNTVRFHVKGVYGKLGVNSRTKAIQAARGMGLLA